MKYFRKGKPLKEDGFYLTVLFMFGDANGFETVSERFDTEDELFNLYNDVKTIFEFLEDKTEYLEVESWDELYKKLGVNEEEFEQRFYEWMPTDTGLFFGKPDEITCSVVEDGKECELEVI